MQYDLTGNPYKAWRKNRQPNAGLDQDRHGSQPELRLRLGLLPWIVRVARVADLPRQAAVLGARDPGPARLRQEPGRRRPAADPDPHHPAHQRPAHPVAYGHTKTDIPADMSRVDHAAFVALGKRMAQRNGYKPEQSSDLYITDGDQIDWMYGRYRIFSFTWELYPTEHFGPRTSTRPTRRSRPRSPATGPPCCTSSTRPIARIRPSTRPRPCAGRCTTTSRSTGAGPATPMAPTLRPTACGRSATPWPCPINGPKQLGVTVSGRAALVTGLAGVKGRDANDLDGGTTTMRSSPVTLPDPVGDLAFSYYFSHASNSTAADWFRPPARCRGRTRTMVARPAGPSTTTRRWLMVNLMLMTPPPARRSGS